METVVSTQARPYPGMRPFEQNDSDLFFGQEPQVATLLQRLGKSRLIVVLGESGCGKSSLVKAGLIPKLLGSRKDPSQALWRIALTRPGRSPIANLAEQLGDGNVLDVPAKNVEALLRSGSHGLLKTIELAKLLPGRRVLVVVDQFEELFRFSRESQQDEPAHWDEAALFVKLLLAVTETSASPEPGAAPLYVVLTMRSEYLGDCALLYGLAEAINHGAYLLPKMTRANLESAIAGPLDAFGATIENSLLQRLLNEAELAQQDGLPLLQHALWRIWDNAERRGSPVRLTTADLEDLPKDAAGDLLLERHLNAHLDQILHKDLNAGQAKLAERTFKQLGEFDNKGRLVRRDPETLLAVVNAFRDEKRGCTFLVPPESRTPQLLAGQEPLDISHEALLRRWITLRRWTEEESRSADKFRELAERANAGSILRGGELVDALRWQREFIPTEEWSARYAGPEVKDLGRRRYDFKVTMAHLARSKRRRRFRFAGYALILLAILVGGITLYLAQARQIENQRDLLAAQEHSKKVEDLNAELKLEEDNVQKVNARLEAQKQDLRESKANLETALAKEQEQRALAQAATKRANQSATAARAESQRANDLYSQSSKDAAELTKKKDELTKKTDDLERTLAQLDKANALIQAAIRAAADRRAADFQFEELGSKPVDSDGGPATHLSNLVTALDDYRKQYSSLPPTAVSTLGRAVSASYRTAYQHDKAGQTIPSYWRCRAQVLETTSTRCAAEHWRAT